MTHSSHNNNHVVGRDKDLRAMLHEAETYRQQGLLLEAKKIYIQALERIQSESNKEGDKEKLANSKAFSDEIRQKIREIERITDSDSVKVKQKNVDSESLPDVENGAALFNKAIALKEIGLFDQAIEKFQKAANEGFRPLYCLTEIGDTLTRQGHITAAIEKLRQVYSHPDTNPELKSMILEKIAYAYQQSSLQMQMAMETYQDLATQDEWSEDLAASNQSRPESKKSNFFLTITRHRWIFFCLSSLIAIAVIMFNPMVKIVDNVDYFTIEDNEDAIFYKNFKKVFGSDEFFVIAFEAEELFSEKNLRMLKAITDDLERIDLIKDVTSLTNVDDTIGEEDYFEVRRFIEDIPTSNKDLKELKRSAISHPLFTDALISKDGKATAILIEAYENSDVSHYKKKLIDETLRVLSKYKSANVEFHLAGDTITSFTLSEYMNADMAVFVPVTYGLIAFTIWFFFKNIPLTIVALINISTCVGATRGFMGLTGLTLNNVTSIVIPLIMALSLCDTVHIFSHMNKRIIDQAPDRFVALAHVLRQIALPCFMTTLTTAVGFISLSVSKIPAIREFAWAASAGMVFEYFFSFFLLPPILLFFNPSRVYQDYSANIGMNQMLHRLADFVCRKHLFILATAAALTLIAIGYASRIIVETNMIDFFKARSPIRVSMNFVESRLSGVSTFDISLKSNETEAFKNPENLAIIENIQKYLGGLKSVDKTISFVDLMKDMNESFNNENKAFYRIPDTKEMVAQYLLLYDSDEINDFVNSTFDHARISVRISEHSSLQQKKLIKQIQNYIDSLKSKMDIRITGRTINEIDTVDDLVRGQILSLAMAGVIISALMALIFKSVPIALLSMVPNFFPILINFGIMGFFKIPLDTGTALIAAVALGIAVDDTIHYLTEYQHQRSMGMPVRTSIKSSILIKGRAILTSSLILSIGFGVTILSRFIPIVHFGLLTALIMLTALLGDLVLLPAILMLKKEKKLIPKTNILEI